MGKRGPYKVAGEIPSEKYPGFMEKTDGTGRFRKSCYRANNGKGPKLYSRYFYEVECVVCGRMHLKDGANIRGQRKRADITGKIAGHICSPTCKSKHQSSPDGNLRRKHGNIANSHILVKAPNHPHAKKDHIPQHRAVVEQALGRYLEPSEIVHHINCLKGDNRLENLDVFQTGSEHFLSHGSLNQCVAALIERGHLIYNRGTQRYEVPS